MLRAHLQNYWEDVALILGKDPYCLSAEAGVRSATLYLTSPQTCSSSELADRVTAV